MIQSHDNYSNKEPTSGPLRWVLVPDRRADPLMEILICIARCYPLVTVFTLHLFFHILRFGQECALKGFRI